jgi:exonuclease SbcC
MKINYIELRNYRKFEHLELELPDGITGIIGNNGTGKSTLVESIAWALFGNKGDIVRAGKDSIRRSGTGPNEATSAELEFTYAGDEYVVKREMSGRSMLINASLTINGKPAADGAGEVSDLLEKKLGMDYKSFFISVFAKQNDLAALSSMKPNERRDIILRMLGIDRLDDAIVEASSRVRSKEDRAEAMRGVLIDGDGEPKRPALEKRKKELVSSSEAANRDVSHLTKELKGLKEKAEGLDRKAAGTKARLKELRETNKKVEAEKASLRERNEDAERIGKELEEAKKAKAVAGKLAAVNGNLAEAKKKKEALAALLRTKSDLESVIEDISATKKGIAKNEEELKKNADVLDSISKQKKQMESLEKEISSISVGRAELKENIKSLKAEADSEERHLEGIDELGPESTCPTCERPLGEHHGELKKKLIASLEKKRAEMAKKEATRKEAGERLAELEKELESEKNRGEALAKKEGRLQRLEGDIEGANKSLGKLLEKRKGLEGAIKDSPVNEAGKDEMNKLDEMIDRLNDERDGLMGVASLARKIPELTEALSKVKTKAEEHERAVKEAKFDPAELELHEAASDEIERKKEEVVAESERINSSLLEATKLSERAAGEARGVQGELDSLVDAEKKLEELEGDLAYALKLSELLKSFRTSLVARIVPTLSQTASELLSQLTEGRYNSLTLNDKYDISIEDGGVDYALERFSGGESDLANLCLRLAISRIIAERAGTQGIDLLVLDEIFGSQDASRKRNLMASFNALANQFRQIILITHIEDIREHLSSIIEVYMDENGDSHARLAA